MGALLVVLVTLGVIGNEFWQEEKRRQDIKLLDERIRKDNPIPRLPFSDTEIPKKYSSATSDRIGITPGGSAYIKDEINVHLFKSTTDPERRIKEIADSTNAIIIGSDQDFLSYELKYNVVSYDELLRIKSELEVMADVEFVTLSWLGYPS